MGILRRKKGKLTKLTQGKKKSLLKKLKGSSRIPLRKIVSRLSRKISRRKDYPKDSR